MAPLTEALRAAVRVLYRWLPKADYAVIWGWPDYEDSVLALEEALQDTRLRRVVLLMTDRTSPPPRRLGTRTTRVAKDSIAGWLAFLFARYVFFTHRCFMWRFPPNVVSVNVWHGMPIKRIGWMSEGDQGIASTYVLATSPFWGDIMCRAMRPTGRALSTGLPRNDRLFLDRAPVWRSLRLDSRSGVDRLLVWLPTYRRSVRGRIRTDGAPTDTPFEFDIDPDELNQLMAEHRTLAVVKPHPMAAFPGEQEWSNLLWIDDAGLRARSLSLYQLLGAADVLVSDVSSVTIDFLLLDRPIVHAIGDLEPYRASRGFSVDAVDDLLAGPVVTDADELLDVLRDILTGGDPGRAHRQRVRVLSHTHTDGGATDRLLRDLGLHDDDRSSAADSSPDGDRGCDARGPLQSPDPTRPATMPPRPGS